MKNQLRKLFFSLYRSCMTPEERYKEDSELLESVSEPAGADQKTEIPPKQENPPAKEPKSEEPTLEELSPALRVKKAITAQVCQQALLKAKWLEAYLMEAEWREELFLFLVKRMEQKQLPYAVVGGLPENMVKDLVAYLNQIDPNQWEAKSDNKTTVTLYLADVKYDEIDC